MSQGAESGALAAIAHGVDADPVFAMSLGSKELFHSNLLDWFIRHHPPVAHALGWHGELTVVREKGHTDLLIRHGQLSQQQVTIIENKVFALPDAGQLARLAESPDAAGSSELVLLSLTSPGWPDGTWTSPCGRTWTWLSYRQLGDRLRPALPAVAEADAYAGATLEHWLDHFTRLEELAWAVGRPCANEPVTLPADQRKILQATRLQSSSPAITPDTAEMPRTAPPGRRRRSCRPPSSTSASCPPLSQQPRPTDSATMPRASCTDTCRSRE